MVLESLGGLSLGGTFPNSFQPGALGDSFCFLENRPLAHTHTHTSKENLSHTAFLLKFVNNQSNKQKKSSGIDSLKKRGGGVSTGLSKPNSFGEVRDITWPCK